MKSAWTLILATTCLSIGIFVIWFTYILFQNQIRFEHVEQVRKPLFGLRDEVIGTGGAFWGDYNNDGHLDAVIPHESKGLLFLEGSAFGTFVEKNIQGVMFPENYQVKDVALADYNNDSCLDMYLVSPWQDRLLQGMCDGTFRDATEQSGIIASKRDDATSAVWADYDNDGLLDLYVTEYGEASNILYHNEGNGSFSVVTEEAGVSGISYCSKTRAQQLNARNSLQAAWFDYNKDNLIDLFVTNDSQAYSPLYRNNGDGTFTEVTKEAGMCRGADAMGIAVGDYDNDLDFDVYVTNAGANLLWENQNDGTFRNVADERGVADVQTLGWGAVFFDYDNDGDSDLYVVNGDVLVRSEHKVGFGDVRFDRFFQNNKGNFRNVANARGLFEEAPNRGVAIGDANRDGFYDLFVGGDGLFKSDPYKLYLNTGNANNWIGLTLRGVLSNKDAVGARIEVVAGGKTQLRHISAGESFNSQHMFSQIVGLGPSTTIEEIRIYWPSGYIQTVQGISSNQYVLISEER